MSKDYTHTVSDLVEAALQKKATQDGITTQELLDNQIDYYVACALYDSFPTASPVNAPDCTIQERQEVFAELVVNGEHAARTMVDEIRAAKGL